MGIAAQIPGRHPGGKTTEWAFLQVEAPSRLHELALDDFGDWERKLRVTRDLEIIADCVGRHEGKALADHPVNSIPD